MPTSTFTDMYMGAHCNLHCVAMVMLYIASMYVAICGGTMYINICVTVLIVCFHYVIKVDAKISTA